MRIGSVANLFLFLILAVHVLSGKPVVAAENDSHKVQEVNTAKVDNLFKIAGKPVDVWLARQEDGHWNFKLNENIPGAIAHVPMEGGLIIEMVWKKKNDKKAGEAEYYIDLKTKGETVTWRLNKLPTGEVVIVAQSKQLYSNRFRMFWVKKGRLSTMDLWFLEDLGKEENKSDGTFK
jgi:hypothetical protein